MPIQFRKEQLPWCMAATRSALGPIIVLGEACRWSAGALVALILAGLLSDIFDGILARRWHCDTPAGSLFDSMADTVFYACVAIALWMSHPHLWHTNWPLLATLITLETTRFAFDFAKFRKPASYHSYMAKMWGLLIAIAVVTEFATGRAGALISAALLFGIACDLEGLAMSIILPAWRSEIKTLHAAWKLRRQILADCSVTEPSQVKLGFTAILILAIVSSASAFAVQPPQAAYVGGTMATVPQGASGTLDTTSSTTLIFKTSPPSPAGQIGIPYANIRSISYSTEVAHHLGVLPAIGASLFTHRQRRYMFSIIYTDDSGAIQSVLIEVPKDQPKYLWPFLRARSPICQNKPSPCVQPYEP